MLQAFDDNYFMKQAIAQAKKAYEEHEVPVGAVIVANNTIIARAHNMTEKLQDVTAHAEILALTAASNHLGAKYLNDCTIYVTLEPCLMCASALSWAQIGKIVWAAPDKKKGYTIYKNTPVLHPKTITQNGLFSEEASELLKMFFANKRRK
jgi:tRNA(adenine34) deaminase